MCSQTWDLHIRPVAVAGLVGVRVLPHAERCANGSIPSQVLTARRSATARLRSSTQHMLGPSAGCSSCATLIPQPGSCLAHGVDGLALGRGARAGAAGAVHVGEVAPAPPQRLYVAVLPAQRAIGVRRTASQPDSMESPALKSSSLAADSSGSCRPPVWSMQLAHGVWAHVQSTHMAFFGSMSRHGPCMPALVHWGRLQSCIIASSASSLAAFAMSRRKAACLPLWGY